MSDHVKVNWSGGKDSTAAAILHLEQGDNVSIACYVPYFDNETPLIGKEHYDFILNTKEYFESMGALVLIVHGLTYCGYVLHVSQKGKYKGEMFGFPWYGAGACGFKRDSKIKALKYADEIIGDYDYEDIGIAFDEPHRFGQLNEKKRSILVEKKITEDRAFTICDQRGRISPHYAHNTRDGCALCFNSSPAERERWFKDWPGSREKLIELENIVKGARPERPPLLQYKWFSDFF